MEQDYHLSTCDYDDLPSPSRTAYLGPGSSARLLECTLKSLIQWHTAHNLQIPKRVLPDEPSPLMGISGFRTLQSFPMAYDQRKIELHSLVPLSTQRAIIEYYSKTVSPEYTLISAEQELALLVYENPLKWSSSNKSHPDAFAISIVFAISTALVARDLDPNVSGISLRCLDDMYKVSQEFTSPADPIEVTRWECTALCALALCELINPSSGVLWDLLGRATSILDHLREGYRLRHLSLDDAFRRLERSLIKLER